MKLTDYGKLIREITKEPKTITYRQYEYLCLLYVMEGSYECQMSLYEMLNNTWRCCDEFNIDNMDDDSRKGLDCIINKYGKATLNWLKRINIEVVDS